jgi:ankyrin repeat protein
VEGHTTATAKLLEHGADTECPVEDGRIALLWVAAKGYKELVLLLLKQDASSVDMDVQDNSGRLPLLWAAEAGYKAVVQLLIVRVIEREAAEAKLLRRFKNGILLQFALEFGAR